MTVAGHGGRRRVRRARRLVVRTAVVVAGLRLGVSVVGPVPTAVVASAAITAAVRVLVGPCVEPRLFRPRRRRGESLARPRWRPTQERHLAFAEALAAVALSYLDHCRVEAQTLQHREQRAVVTTDRPIGSAPPVPRLAQRSPPKRRHAARRRTAVLTTLATDEPAADGHRRLRSGSAVCGDRPGGDRERALPLRRQHRRRRLRGAEGRAPGRRRCSAAGGSRCAPSSPASTSTGTGAPPRSRRLADALLVLEGTAQDDDEHDALTCASPATTAPCGSTSATPTARAVRITADPAGRSRTRRPVLFRRTALTARCPTPTRGGELDELWRWLNVDPDDRPLLAAWLVAALVPTSPTRSSASSASRAPARSTRHEARCV